MKHLYDTLHLIKLFVKQYELKRYLIQIKKLEDENKKEQDIIQLQSTIFKSYIQQKEMTMSYDVKDV